MQHHSRAKIFLNLLILRRRETPTWTPS